MKHLVRSIKGAVSIEDTRIIGATDAQIALLKRMNQCVKANIPLPYEDVRDIYFYLVRAKGKRKDYVKIEERWNAEKVDESLVNGSNCYWFNRSGYDYGNIPLKYGYYKTETYINNWLWKETVTQWFRVNIGSMVLKNMLVAIPVIDLDRTDELNEPK